MIPSTLRRSRLAHLQVWFTGPFYLLFITQPPKLVLSAVEWARFIGIAAGETCVVGFAFSSGFGWGVINDE